MATVEEGDYPQVFSSLTKGPITQFVLEGKQVTGPELHVPQDDAVSYRNCSLDLSEFRTRQIMFSLAGIFSRISAHQRRISRKIINHSM